MHIEEGLELCLPHSGQSFGESLSMNEWTDEYRLRICALETLPGMKFYYHLLAFLIYDNELFDSDMN